MRLWPALACVVCVGGLISSGCAPARTAPRGTPRPDTSIDTRTLPPFARGIVTTALSLAGAPYRTGGAEPGGFDCSGYVAYVFGVHGVRLPRTVAGLYLAGSPVRGDRVAAGDLLFFETSGAGASHVAIALGGGRFIHAPNSGRAVGVESLASQYWGDRYVGARRIGPPRDVPDPATRR
jgi:cell wall-associated NlpC family hydrolase